MRRRDISCQSELSGHPARPPTTSHISHLQISLTAEQKALYPELAKLQDDINRLKENELQLRNQIFYTGSQADLSNAGSAQIGYSY